MSSEEDGDKPVGEGETFETSAEKSRAEGDDGKGANERKKDTEEGKKTQKRNTLVHTILFTGAILCIGAAIYFARPKNEIKADFDLVRVFRNGLENLQTPFANQTHRFWKILRSRGLAYLQSKDPLQPLVFLLAAPPAAHEYVDCLAIKLAKMLDPRHKDTLARFCGEEEKVNPPEKTKIRMDNFLKKKIKALHRVVLIHHLELLPPPSPHLFHSYCDDQNAPYKHLAIIFTVHMPVEPNSSLSPKQAEESVKKYLSGDVWAKDDVGEVAALLVRVAYTVVLMNGESSGSARDFCSESTNC